MWHAHAHEMPAMPSPSNDFGGVITLKRVVSSDWFTVRGVVYHPGSSLPPAEWFATRRVVPRTPKTTARRVVCGIGTPNTATALTGVLVGTHVLARVQPPPLVHRTESVKQTFYRRSRGATFSKVFVNNPLVLVYSVSINQALL